MPIEKIRILSILVLGASLAAYLAGDFGLPFFAVQIITILPLWFPINLDQIRRYRFWKIYGPLTLAFFAWSYFAGMALRTNVFLLVLFCLIYEFYGEARLKAPTRLISLLSLLIFLYQAKIDSGLMLFIGLVIYLLSVLFYLKASYLGEQTTVKLSHVARTQFLPLVGHLVFILPLSLLVFWILPRLPQQSLTSLPSLGGAKNLSGFSGRVTLTDIGRLKLSRKHVMDITPLNGVLHNRYLKGRALDYYEDGIWSEQPYAVNYKRPRGNRYIFANNQIGYSYRIEQVALQGNPVFFFNSLIEVKGSLNPLRVDGMPDHLSVLRGYPLALTYTVTAGGEPWRAWPMSNRRYLQIPRGHEYFREISDIALAGQETMSAPQQALALLRYFRQNFRYTLDIRNQGVSDPLRDFLVNRREGHCELFASSMVMMLRAQGIPARLVTGFLVPQIHPSGQFFAVTEADAHAWVEFQHEGYWYTIDPTPPSDLIGPSFGENQMAYFRRFWRHMIIAFDFDAQIGLFRGIATWVISMLTFITNYPVVLLSLLLGSGLIFYLLKYRPLLLQPESRIKRLFLRIDRQLRDTYRPRHQGEGMYDYIRRLQLDAGLEIPLVAFMKDYHYFRFGNGMAPDVVRDITLKGAAVLRAIKKRRKRA